MAKEKIDQDPKYWDRLFAKVSGILAIITTVD